MTIIRERLDELARTWRRRAIVRDTIFALAGVMALAALKIVWPAIPWLVPAAGFAIILACRLALNRPWNLNAALLVRHLDRSYPALEESCELWLRPFENLTLLERLQLKRLNRAVLDLRQANAPSIFRAPPGLSLRLAQWCLLGGAAVLALAEVAALQRARLPTAPRAADVGSARHSTVASPPAAPVWPKIAGSELFIVPPPYTGRPARRVDGFNAEVEEGASVTWRLALDQPVREARLVFGEAGAESLALHPVPGAGNRLEGTRPVNNAGLYHLSATLPAGAVWSPPELFSLKVIRDRPPTVRIVQPALPRTLLDSTAAPFTVECVADDDYGLADVHLVATVAKGAGEAVKFREQSIAFDTNEPAANTPAGTRRLLKALNLAALGLEPGDELYFYVEARDNRQPTANRTRSETRFVTIKGPTETPPAGGLGVAGVNLVPQYFRSERQIIIDTEKLLADQPGLPAEEFRRRADDLGVDQQLLRLRYGQFVGEELEQGSVSDHTEINLNPLQAAPVQRAGPHAAASVAMRFLQEHAQQDRAGADPGQETGLQPAPDHPLSADQVRAPYVDQHDSQDKATFFDHETKGTLKDALGDMWRAEGYLRTTRPQEALAPEHHALDILKDLQQSARAYVQHVGFEPPPLKIAERRLKGDVADVPERGVVPSETASNPGANSLAEARAALALVPWNQPPLTLNPAQAEALRRSEPALTSAASGHPEIFLEGLRALRRLLAGGNARAGDDFPKLEPALLHLLPAAGLLPDRRVDPAPSLGGSYFQALSQTPAGERAP